MHLTGRWKVGQRATSDAGDVYAKTLHVRWWQLVVTHDVNLAAQFADKVLLMKDGRTVHNGKPEGVLRPDLLQEAFRVRVLVDAHPITGVPRITPVHEIRRQF